MADAITSTSASSDLAYVAASRRSTSSNSSSVNFEDYITLMVAQLTNQDMHNTADTTEMTSQLAQYSLVSAAETIVTGQNTNYAATLVGKQVTASYEDSQGNLVTNTGIVSGITLYEGEPLVYVNGTPYNLSEIMIVGTTSPVDDSTDSESETVNAVEETEQAAETEEEAVSSVDDTQQTEAAEETAAETVEETAAEEGVTADLQEDEVQDTAAEETQETVEETSESETL